MARIQSKFERPHAPLLRASGSTAHGSRPRGICSPQRGAALLWVNKVPLPNKTSSSLPLLLFFLCEHYNATLLLCRSTHVANEVRCHICNHNSVDSLRASRFAILQAVGPEFTHFRTGNCTFYVCARVYIRVYTVGWLSQTVRCSRGLLIGHLYFVCRNAALTRAH